MTAHSTYSDLTRELNQLEEGLAEAEVALLDATRQAAYDLIKSTLNRRITPDAFNRWISYLARSDLFSPERARILDTSFGTYDQRVSDALKQCGALLSSMGPDEIVEYIGLCHQLGLELANDRRSQKISRPPAAAPTTQLRAKATLIRVYKRARATLVKRE